MRVTDKKVVYPAAFNSNLIREHPDYENDLKKVIEKSGARAKFLGLYMQRLKFLDDERELCSQRTKWFELLKHADGDLYAMRLDFEKNIRILFAFVDYAGTQYAILLYPFQEKERGKTKDSYKAATPVALKRLNDIREGLKDV
ncbi:MAG: hypothetical protein SCJ94_10080 [Bacillota bacterium]|nr:hypothetical protein [Patescibacteria group bacterium]MDW7730335.1 hypothetical protein [Bacillota bacterium]